MGRKHTHIEKIELYPSLVEKPFIFSFEITKKNEKFKYLEIAALTLLNPGVFLYIETAVNRMRF